MSDRPQTAYKVLTAEQLSTLERDGRFGGAPVDLADGYIHLSTAAQLTDTVARHFAGQDDLHVAAVDLSAYAADTVRWEEARGGQSFPHLYDVLLLDTVVAYGPLERDGDGAVKLPVAG
ncbi:hypothetical protein ASG29_13295 [Sphingomonas sp. Leaf412]|uniref:DUF952 domain-containing protein n=1 Tax=Sphingomonas sp. Leaf412 TaxID=1736370 RepID=UPI0006F56337|nr:DUF952 domain-containing protein [Sphingomonas sp. Leaf412]KQT32701.1 hypothetical protein ASG29_13295 [Sphingomonas sp. Leaf412]